jgi:hypothetical protein
MFSGILFALKIEKKKKPILSNWAEPEGPTQVRTGPAAGPPKPIGAQRSLRG